MSEKTPCGASDPSRRERLRRRREKFIAWLLTDTTVGGESVPNSWSSLQIRPKNDNWDGATRYDVRFVDDSFGLMAWKGADEDFTADSAYMCMNVRADVFRRIALWYLWRWAVGEWFGLRRWLYYKRLFRRLNSYRRMYETSEVR